MAFRLTRQLFPCPWAFDTTPYRIKQWDLVKIINGMIHARIILQEGVLGSKRLMSPWPGTDKNSKGCHIACGLATVGLPRAVSAHGSCGWAGAIGRAARGRSPKTVTPVLVRFLELFSSGTRGRVGQKKCQKISGGLPPPSNSEGSPWIPCREFVPKVKK